MPRFSLYLSNGRATVGVLFFLLLLNCLLFEVFEEFKEFRVEFKSKSLFLVVEDDVLEVLAVEFNDVIEEADLLSLLLIATS